MKNKIFFKLFLLASTSLAIGCGQTDSSQSQESVESESESSIEEISSSSEEPISRTNPIVLELKDVNNATKTPLKGPFSILTEAGEPASIEYGQNQYDNLYEAIRVAGANATTKVKLQVQDENFVQVFQRDKKTSCYVFDGANYVGKAGSSTAKKYCFSHPESYAINGFASDYTYLGRRDMVEGQEVTENVLETNAGAYNYMFSKGGSGGDDLGYRYCTADVLLSQASYAPPADGGEWNAYIFINLAEGISADLGLIGHWTGTRLEWWFFRSCSSSTHSSINTEKDAHFYVFQNSTITYSTQYDPETRLCSGFDDLHFEVMTMDDGWVCNITNMRTGAMKTLDHHHTDGSGNAVKENVYAPSSRVLIASSYCPVTGTIWNWDSKAAFNNCVWTNISMKKAIVKDDGSYSQDIEDYRNESASYPLYPDENTYRDGYSQGGWRSSHVFSKFEEDGTSDSGIEHKKDQKYISFSVDYGNSD